jgi:hypothetical protein
MFDHLQDRTLNTTHDGIGPEPGIHVEMRGDSLATAQMEQRVAIGERFQGVLAFQHIEIVSTDLDVLIECRGGNVVGIGVNAEAEDRAACPSGRWSR